MTLEASNRRSTARAPHVHIHGRHAKCMCILQYLRSPCQLLMRCGGRWWCQAPVGQKQFGGVRLNCRAIESFVLAAGAWPKASSSVAACLESHLRSTARKKQRRQCVGAAGVVIRKTLVGDVGWQDTPMQQAAGQKSRRWLGTVSRHLVLERMSRGTNIGRDAFSIFGRS